MRDYEPDRTEWKSELGSAAARFLANVAYTVPLIGMAVAASIFFHTLFADPFGFTCKSIPAERPAVKRRVPAPVLIHPPRPSEVTQPMVEPSKLESTQE